jgi:hypothetical protein
MCGWIGAALFLRFWCVLGETETNQIANLYILFVRLMSNSIATPINIRALAARKKNPNSSNW